jgi:purine-nucleoside phosphorylase
MLRLKDKVEQSLAVIRPLMTTAPRIALVLGSGLGDVAASVQNAVTISTRDIPHYPVSTVPGHSGRWIMGDIAGVPTLCIQGRVHFYEGYSLAQVTYYVHLLAGLGIRNLILTTSCGGLNPEFRPGDLMLITDLINFTFDNPLIGRPEEQLGSRFPDMSTPFDPNFLAIAEGVGIAHHQPFRKGVFCWVTGPNYETAAEVRALRLLGGDAVSMSTAPEVIVARQRRLRVLGISLITNPATGLSSTALRHADVTQTAAVAGRKLQALLAEIIRGIALFDRATETTPQFVS